MEKQSEYLRPKSVRNGIGRIINPVTFNAALLAFPVLMVFSCWYQSASNHGMIEERFLLLTILSVVLIPIPIVYFIIKILGTAYSLKTKRFFWLAFLSLLQLMCIPIPLNWINEEQVKNKNK
jgi:hypothetical protein